MSREGVSASISGSEMTIRKGEPWGEPAGIESPTLMVSTDSELAAVLQGYRNSQTVAPVIGLLGGSLHRTLGAPQRDEAALRAGEGYIYPIDVGILEFSDAQGEQREVVFVAHLLALTDPRSRLWKGRTVIAMNAAFLDDLNLAPKSHPNDGRLDVTDGQLDRSQRRQALRRAVTGSHLPHPALMEQRVSTRLEIRGETDFRFLADGLLCGAARQFSITCMPDAARILL